MKKYKIGGSPFVIGFIAFWCLCCLGMGVGVAIAFHDAGATSLVALFPLLMFAFGFYLLITSIQGLTRKNKALNGKSSTGKVTNLYFQRSGGEHPSVSQMLEVEYKTESGTDAAFITQIDFRDAKYFEIGKTIPIRVSGEYAYYDMEALKSGKPVYEENVSSKKITCSCGYSFENGLLYCPKCGKAVEDMEDCGDESHGHSNFCPACGSKLDPTDKFCRNCGYKL